MWNPHQLVFDGHRFLVKGCQVQVENEILVYNTLVNNHIDENYVAAMVTIAYLQTNGKGHIKMTVVNKICLFQILQSYLL